MAKKQDILIMQGVSDSNNIQPVSLGFGEVARSVVGIQKAAQCWMIKFLTVQGSVKSDESFGTLFLLDIAGANINDLQTIRGFFDNAVRAVLDWDNANLTTADLADDERIVSADLVNLSANKTSLQLQVKLTSAAGDSRVYITPLPVA